MNKKIFIILAIIAWPLTNMGSKEPEQAAINPIKSYKIFIVEHSSSGSNNLHQLEQNETLTIAELKINVAQLINLHPSLFQLVHDHKKGVNDIFENEPTRTLQSHFAHTQSAWLFTFPSCASLSNSSSSSTSARAIQAPPSEQELADQLK